VATMEVSVTWSTSAGPSAVRSCMWGSQGWAMIK
jgi:hypothetical protein